MSVLGSPWSSWLLALPDLELVPQLRLAAGYLMDDEEPPLAYEEALRMIVAGAQPYVLQMEDGLHVISVVPTSRDVLRLMINDDTWVRLDFITKTAVAIHDHAAAAL